MIQGDLEGAAALTDKVVANLKFLNKRKCAFIIDFYKYVIKGYEAHNGLYPAESYIDRYKLELVDYLLMWEDYEEASKLFDEIVLVITENTSEGGGKVARCVKTSLFEIVTQGPGGQEKVDEYCQLPKDLLEITQHFPMSRIMTALKNKIKVKSEKSSHDNII
ncbi:hypothetical protein RF11_02091 [Thelohanellus kitauei]|uniref:Uncharacterized protein n=1 Tax=Thelohanellus kitauei TaxID=669202 RepID=A0A0C2MH06_THEKT|nr:hypothetical protein RF11_02091 [Thelohanellus kitauei]